MNHLRPTRRQLLQGTGGLVITFTLGAVLKRGVHAQADAEATGPGTVQLPPDQTEQPIQTREASQNGSLTLGTDATSRRLSARMSSSLQMGGSLEAF